MQIQSEDRPAFADVLIFTQALRRAFFLGISEPAQSGERSGNELAVGIYVRSVMGRDKERSLV